MVYVSSDVRQFYLSNSSLRALGILPRNFPTIGGSDPWEDKPDACDCTIAESRTHITNKADCGCPQRDRPPGRPTQLPFPCHPENNSRMKQWLLKHFASSTFNVCPHQQLPIMKGPPVEIHLDPSATPRAYHTAVPIPLHWKEQVYNDLVRDESLGVIERVPYGEPSTWCHRMVVSRKHDGTPRRTIDLSPLNRFCKREPFNAESPFHLARRVPGQTWKTVTDAWNGYHSAPLREADRHLTTFITPFGRWRYCRAPQGFLASGDGYNRRFDAIISDFVRKERCVDDTIFYDDDLEAHWWRTIDFLTIVGDAGIVLHPDKFQFAEKTVDFAGFRISEQCIEPLAKFIDAIKSFPTPASTTDIRSWFGLINQVGNYAQLREYMAPFKPFLSPKHAFAWTPALNDAFEASKRAIIDAIKTGVRIFDVDRTTCLRPDWSRQGIGYLLLQKHCRCSSAVPDCCQDGWRIVLAVSRFLSDAESRYAPVEGEALAVAWGLEQTRFFTQGCDDLLIVTDHKPLVKIFGDRTLDEITNTRLFRLKQRTLPWFFRIIHLSGKSNTAADAMSRYPSPLIDTQLLDHHDLVDQSILGAIHHDATEVFALPWSRIANETEKDGTMQQLIHAIASDFPLHMKDIPTIASFWPYRKALYVSDGVIMYQDRVVVPPHLRRSVLHNLHSAHQGTSQMEQRARNIVFWPGMTAEIQATRGACHDCNRNAPSLAHLPPIVSRPPSTPFESIFADYFDLAGTKYLVVGDRLSGWTEVFGGPSGSSPCGAVGLVRCLRLFFATFGVPEQISSDGGPEFTATITKTFLTRWGVDHRVSSPYNPRSNGRAEVAVKTARRLLRTNLRPNGSLDNDGFLRAMLQLRNTPDPDCNVSPAQIIFGRPIRDALSFMNRLEKFSNRHIRHQWRDAWERKEIALRTRFVKSAETLRRNAKQVKSLHVGDKCFLQNNVGHHPRRWDRSGTVVDVCENDQYIIKIDGSGRVVTRNRRHLRRFIPASTEVALPAPSTSHMSYPASSEWHDGDQTPEVNVPQSSTIPSDDPVVDPVDTVSRTSTRALLSPEDDHFPHCTDDVARGNTSVPASPVEAEIPPVPGPPVPRVRPRRQTRKPAWQTKGDWDMSFE